MKHEQLIDEAMENSEQQSTNAWDVIAAETQHEQYDCDEEGTQEDPDHAILLPGDNLRHGQETLHLSQPGVSLPMAIESQPLLLPFDDYSKHMQTLNKEQYEVLQIILN